MQQAINTTIDSFETATYIQVQSRSFLLESPPCELQLKCNWKFAVGGTASDYSLQKDSGSSKKVQQTARRCTGPNRQESRQTRRLESRHDYNLICTPQLLPKFGGLAAGSTASGQGCCCMVATETPGFKQGGLAMLPQSMVAHCQRRPSVTIGRPAAASVGAKELGGG